MEGGDFIVLDAETLLIGLSERNSKESIEAVLPLCFGENSFARHQQAAKVARTRWRVVRARGVARDVDEPEDLDRLDANDPDLGESTARWLVATDINVSLGATHRAC